ncbi:alpha/beta fold hydrolase [Aureimonas sp. AU20]|uniref:alpha/beta fold hydrolase n=1 Tax=Aureimonas sp. AU20 TaxID=1349819 RepID=UPI0007226D76|nr:alpha/beta hydrolase [Aureimonas sp. AU20]ALN75358.1 hypothetical protein M673_21720 [Aureimonas sp. AU20]
MRSRNHATGLLAILSGLAVVPQLGGLGPAWADETPAACTDIDGARCFVDLPTGIRMAYVEVGPSGGRTVLLLHGLTDSARSWSQTMAALHAKDPALHIVALDLRGHGQSAMPAAETCAREPKLCFTPRLFADDVLAFMDGKGIGTASLAGHSMGSMVAQEIALEHPERIEATVLVASSNRTAGNAVLADYVLKEPVLGSWKAGLDAKGLTDPMAVWSATPLDADPNAETWIAANWDVDPAADPALVQAITKETAHVRLGTWRGATQALLDVDNTERLGELRVPTLVLWGTQDAIFTRDPDQSGLMEVLGKAARAHGTPVVWKQYGVDPLPASGAQTSDIGHNVQWDAPDQVADDILSFLATGAPTPDGTRAVIEKDAATLVTMPGKAEIVRP